MAIFLCPVPFVLGALLAFLDVSSDLAATVCAILLLVVLFLTVVDLAAGQAKMRLPGGYFCIH